MSTKGTQANTPNRPVVTFTKEELEAAKREAPVCAYCKSQHYDMQYDFHTKRFFCDGKCWHSPFFCAVEIRDFKARSIFDESPFS